MTLASFRRWNLPSIEGRRVDIVRILLLRPKSPPGKEQHSAEATDSCLLWNFASIQGCPLNAVVRLSYCATESEESVQSQTNHAATAVNRSGDNMIATMGPWRRYCEIASSH